MSHSISVEKFKIYDIRGPAHDWFKSYLSNRKQFTTVYNNCSSLKSVYSGVPQGSLLGSALLLIYINDIIHCSNKLNLPLFADATTIYMSGDNPIELHDTFNREMRHVSKWINSTKLQLNVSKTCFMISHPIMQNMVHDIDIKISGTSLNQVDKIKFLGVTIYKTSWESQVYKLGKNPSKFKGILYKKLYRLILHESNIIYSCTPATNVFLSNLERSIKNIHK